MEKEQKFTSWMGVLLIAAITFWGLHEQKPSADHFDSDNPADFSVDNVMEHLKVLSKDVHFVGTPGHQEVQDYIVNELEKLGLETEIQTQHSFNRNQSFVIGTNTQNILARIEGSGDGKALVILSHYDSVPTASHGASDAGSGVATILEGLRVYLEKREQPVNDIIILITDAEELGLLGARAFVQYHPWADDVGLVLNFEARGSGGPSQMIIETNGKNGKMIREFRKANPSFPTANSLSYSVYKLLPNDTDNTPFREIGNIDGYFFAFIDDFFDYHTAQDTWQRTDLESLSHQGDYLMSVLPYFANSDLSDFSSDQDMVYITFPLVKLIYYPFSWNTPLVIIASILFAVLFVLGVRAGKLRLKSSLMGFIPFLLSLILSCLIAFGGWWLLGKIYPGYNEIIHGFTYNGYYYIAAFSAVSVCLTLFFYHLFFRKHSGAEMIIAPLFFWLVLNAALVKYLPGAGFLIIPVFMALGILVLLIYTELPHPKKMGVFILLSIPLLYILPPFIHLFPVALNLDLLPVSAFFVVLLIGLITPVLYLITVRKHLIIGTGTLFLVLMVIASVKSGFNEDRKKPVSLSFYFNTETNQSYWASNNQNVDEYLYSVMGDQVQEESFSAESGFPGSSARYFAATDNLALQASSIAINKDSVSEGQRFLEFTISPLRKVNMYTLRTLNDLVINSLSVTGNPVEAADYEGSQHRRNQNQAILYYVMSNLDENLRISFSIADSLAPEFFLEEVSADLLTNPLFDLPERPSWMMTAPGRVGDAIIVGQTVSFE